MIMKIFKQEQTKKSHVFPHFSVPSASSCKNVFSVE